MATTRNFIRRGKLGKFMIKNILYFKSPSRDRTRIYHYKQLIKVNRQASRTVQITKEKYEYAKKRKIKESRRKLRT